MHLVPACNLQSNTAMGSQAGSGNSPLVSSPRGVVRSASESTALGNRLERLRAECQLLYDWRR